MKELDVVCRSLEHFTIALSSLQHVRKLQYIGMNIITEKISEDIAI